MLMVGVHFDASDARSGAKYPCNHSPSLSPAHYTRTSPSPPLPLIRTLISPNMNCICFPKADGGGGQTADVLLSAVIITFLSGSPRKPLIPMFNLRRAAQRKGPSFVITVAISRRSPGRGISCDCWDLHRLNQWKDAGLSLYPASPYSCFCTSPFYTSLSPRLRYTKSPSVA